MRDADADHFFKLGNETIGRGEVAQAIDAYRQAIGLKPDYAEAHMNLGNALKLQGKLADAIALYRTAIELQPHYLEAHTNLGLALQETGKLGEAIAILRRAVQIRPDHPKALSGLLFALNYDDTLCGDIFAAHREWQARFGRPTPQPVAYDNSRTPGRRLKIGYVSADFHFHSAAYFMEPLLKEHDRQAVDVFCYADVRRPDGVTAYFQGFAEHWLMTLGMSDDALAERIRGDGIDILVDLAGHTANNRLGVFARKPAPVQATWLGYPNTTGLSAIDYRLVDAVTDPPGAADALASETLLRLPGGFLCYGGLTGAPEPKGPPCLTTGAVTFGSFNNPAKLSAATCDAWAALLARLPQARLLLKGGWFVDAATRALYLARLTERGVAADRVELMPRVSGAAAHLSVYERVDVALDPFPYNGTTTTCEALWMGVPVVSLRGTRHAGRVGASLLTQAGLPELIADSAADYLDIAAALAADPARLNALRHTLRLRVAASPLCDGPGFARKMEAAYGAMWQHWCEAAGKTPR
jgi:protein O-GlcNAc transferase